MSTLSTPTQNFSDSNSTSSASVHPQQTQNAEQWHLHFQIPSHFSTRTEEAITRGLLTKGARIEIIQSIAAAMMVHTKNPTSIQYNLVCQKLIEKYPTLKDTIGTTGYVSFYHCCAINNNKINAHVLYYQGSWKEKLRNRFKFVRRPPSNSYPTDSTAANPPPPKRQKRTKKSARLGSDMASMLSGDEEEYEENVSRLQLECSKRKKDRSITTMIELTMSKYKKRREWIMSDTPSVSDILQKFPSLKHRKVVSSSTINYVIFALLCHAMIYLTFLVTS